MFDIHVHIHGDNSELQRLTTAVHLAARLDGRVCCIQVSPEPRLVSVDPFGGSYLTPELAELRQQLDRQERARIETWLDGHGAPFIWRHEYGDPGAALARAARLADLVVLSAGPQLIRRHDRPLSVAGRFLANSRAPALLLPEHGGYTAGGPIAVAWDGSADAAIALRSAMPLLRCATRVHLLSVGEDAQSSLDEATHYLAARQINAQPQRLDPSGGLVTSSTLREAALDCEADLLVMGAFGGGRMRELIFGGVTEAMLEDMPFPLFLSH